MKLGNNCNSPKLSGGGPSAQSSFQKFCNNNNNNKIFI